MFEFRGKISGEACKLITKKTLGAVWFFALIGAIVTLPCWYIISVAFGFENPIVWGICISAFPVVVISIDLAILLIRKNNGTNSHVYFDGERVVEKEEKGTELYAPISDVKCVEDHGDFYAIICKHNTKPIICQKECLVRGSIKDLETIFKGKIKKMK